MATAKGRFKFDHLNLNIDLLLQINKHWYMYCKLICACLKQKQYAWVVDTSSIGLSKF